MPKKKFSPEQIIATLRQIELQREPMRPVQNPDLAKATQPLSITLLHTSHSHDGHPGHRGTTDQHAPVQLSFGRALQSFI
jgi:hypothetical protein